MSLSTSFIPSWAASAGNQEPTKPTKLAVAETTNTTTTTTTTTTTESKSTTERSDEIKFPIAPRRKRWAAVSATANADEDYKRKHRDPAHAYAYITIHRPYFSREPEEGEDDDGGDDVCDCEDTNNCLELKPAEDLPYHPYRLTNAGYQKYSYAFSCADYRYPDMIGMHTVSTHAAYGVVQVIQNLCLDFQEAKGNWKEQWAICEAMAMFVIDRGAMYCMITSDYVAGDTSGLVGLMILSMLSHLEDMKLLSDQSEVKNVGMILAMYIKYAKFCKKEKLIEKDGKIEAQFDDLIFAYVVKHHITLNCVGGLAELRKDLVLKKDLLEMSDIVAEPRPRLNGNDPWKWDEGLAFYIKIYSKPSTHSGWVGIGGDDLDLTTWTSAQRKEMCWDNEDPLSQTKIDLIAAGEYVEFW